MSNQPAPRPEPPGRGDGRAAVWHFPPTPRISTYLTAIAAGEYHLVTDSHTTPCGQVFPLGVACRRSLASHLDADEIFAITKQGLDYFTGLFAAAYPFAKYDQVFVTDQRRRDGERRLRDDLRAAAVPVQGHRHGARAAGAW